MSLDVTENVNNSQVFSKTIIIYSWWVHCKYVGNVHNTTWTVWIMLDILTVTINGNKSLESIHIYISSSPNKGDRLLMRTKHKKISSRVTN